MATIISFPCLNKNDGPLDEQPDAHHGSMSKDFESLVEEFQGNLASIRAHFVDVQKNLDLIIAAKKDPQTS